MENNQEVPHDVPIEATADMTAEALSNSNSNSSCSGDNLIQVCKCTKKHAECFAMQYTVDTWRCPACHTIYRWRIKELNSTMTPREMVAIIPMPYQITFVVATLLIHILILLLTIIMLPVKCIGIAYEVCKHPMYIKTLSKTKFIDCFVFLASIVMLYTSIPSYVWLILGMIEAVICSLSAKQLYTVFIRVVVGAYHIRHNGGMYIQDAFQTSVLQAPDLYSLAYLVKQEGFTDSNKDEAIDLFHKLIREIDDAHDKQQ